MGKTKAKYENVGRLQTIYTINFEDPESILDIISPLIGNKRLRKQILKLGLVIIHYLTEEDTLEGSHNHVTKLLSSVSPVPENPLDLEYLLQTIGTFISRMSVHYQVIVYKMLGEQLNLPLREQSEGTPSMEKMDITKLLDSYRNIWFRSS